MVSQCMRFTRLPASFRTSFVFFLVWGYNAYVSHACLHRLRRILSFPWYGVTMHAFHTLFCIYYDGFSIFLLSGHNACISHAIKTAFVFIFVSCYNACVSHTCLRRLKRLFRVPLYGFKHMCFTGVFASVKTAFACFSPYCITMHHTRVCIG